MDEVARPLRAILTHVADGVLVVDADGLVRFVNPAAERLLGRSAAELLGSNLGQPIVIGEMAEMVVMRKDGSLVTVELRAAQVTWEGAPAVVASLRDMSERVRAQARVEHLNSVLSAIRNVNQLIVREKDPARLIQQTCDLLIETRGYTRARIATGDGRAPPTGFAQAGWGERFEPFAASLREGQWPPCWKACVASEEVITIRDPKVTCEGCPLADDYGDRTALTTTLRHGGEVLGQIGVSMPGDLPLDRGETSLLAEVAADVAFALHTIDTERLQREGEARFELVTESSPDAIFLSDRMGNCTYANAAASELLGYSTDELLKLNIADVAARDRVPEYLQIFEELLVEGRLSIEIDFLRKDGTAVPVDVNAVLLTSGHVYASCRDLSARKRADEVLEASEKRYRRLFEAATGGILILDAETGEVVDANPHMTALTGRSHEDFVGKHLWDLGFFKDATASRAAFAELQTKRFVRYEDLPLEGADGRKVDVEFVSNVYEVDHRRVIQCNIRDVTDMKLMRAQIAQSDRLATMGMLAAGVAHEINNPLAYVLYNLESLTADLPKLSSAILKCSSIIGERLGNEEWASVMGKEGEVLSLSMLDDIGARFDDALQGSRRIRDVARGLGTFSRVERNRMAPVVLMQVLELAINMAFNEIKYRARLVKDYGPTSTVLANDGRLSQVFLNLLVNAAHAIPEGDAEHNEIRVRTWQEGDEVLAEVRDTGNGIPSENMSHLFEPFFTTKDVGVGTGLGLSISKAIVEECGGRIMVASEVGKGTSFVVRLPVAKAAAEDEAVRAEVVTGAVVRGRILVVDDEVGIRAAMVRMLRGHDVVEAVSGEEARTILEADQAFDLVLCDMMMPIVSGVELHEWLLATHPDLANRLVFITGGAFTPKAQEHLNKVSNIRIDKPFDVGNFKKIVAELVVAYRARRS